MKVSPDIFSSIHNFLRTLQGAGLGCDHSNVLLTLLAVHHYEQFPPILSPAFSLVNTERGLLIGGEQINLAPY